MDIIIKYKSKFNKVLINALFKTSIILLEDSNIINKIQILLSKNKFCNKK